MSINARGWYAWLWDRAARWLSGAPALPPDGTTDSDSSSSTADSSTDSERSDAEETVPVKDAGPEQEDRHEDWEEEEEDAWLNSPERRLEYVLDLFHLWLELPPFADSGREMDEQHAVMFRDMYRLAAALAAHDSFARVPSLPQHTPLVCRKILRYALDPETSGSMPGRLFACLAFFQHSRVPSEVVLEALRQLMLLDHDVSRVVVRMVRGLGWPHRAQ